jgi:type III pantothenate kinase
MNLVIDQGNTLFKAGLFNDNELVSSSTFEYTQIIDFNYWVQSFGEKCLNVIVSSVISHKIDLSALNIDKVIFLNTKTPLPIANLYKTPKTLGNDRITNAVAAWSINPNKNSLIIDIGTCIKYDLVNKLGQYIGGNITPGLKMRYKSLNSFTDQLPLLEPNNIDYKIGFDTESSIKCGVQDGIKNEINGFIERYDGMFGDLTIFMTGGDTKFFDKSVKNHIFANSNLTLIGLNVILKYNG